MASRCSPVPLKMNTEEGAAAEEVAEWNRVRCGYRGTGPFLLPEVFENTSETASLGSGFQK